MKTRLTVLIIVLAVLVLCVGLYAYNTKQSPQSAVGALFGGLTKMQSPGSQGVSTVDLSDDRALIGMAHYFFVGKVISQGDIKQASGFTFTQYTIDVILNIKGKLKGETMAYGHELRPGSTYLMGARWNWNNLQLIIIFDDGKKLLTSDVSLTNDQLKALAEKDKRVIALQAAYPHEILYSLDFAQNTTWNSYESLKAGKLFVPGTTEEYPLHIRYVNADSPTDFTDDRKLVGYAHYVFVGKVLKQIDNDDSAGFPVSRFVIDVILNIKGELHSPVTVGESVGFRNGTCFIARIGVDSSVEYPGGCADILLQPGSTYLIVSRYIEGLAYLRMVSPQYDHALISADAGMEGTNLRALGEANERVIALSHAYPNEVLPEADTKYKDHNTAYNNYQSLQSGQLFTPPPFAPDQIPSLNPQPNESGQPIAPANESASQNAPVTEASPTESVLPSATPELTAAPEPSIEVTASPEPSVIPSETPTPSPEISIIPSETPTLTPEPVQS